MYSGGSGLSIDIHFVDIELSYDVLSPLPIVLSKHFNHPHPYIEIATAISDNLQAVPYHDLLLCRKKGMKPYIIPVGGASPLGEWGYIEAFNEMIKQVLCMLCYTCITYMYVRISLA